MKPAGTYLHFEGTYRGVYRGGKVSNALGAYTFKELDWIWLEVTPITKLTTRNVEEERVLDFYFAPQLPKKAMIRWPSQQGTQVLILGPEKKAFAGTIFDVVMWKHTLENSSTEINIKDANGKPVALDAIEISGTIRFSIPDKTVVTPQPTLVNTPSQLQGTLYRPATVNYHVDNTHIHSSLPNVPTSALPTSPSSKSSCLGNLGGLIICLLMLKWMPIIAIFLLLGLIANALGIKGESAVNQPQAKNNFGCLSTILLMTGLLTCFQSFNHASRTTIYALIFITLCYLISRIQTKMIWRVLIGIVFVISLVAYWSNYFHVDWQRIFQHRNKEGRTQIEPPIPIEVTDRDGNKKLDSLFHHEVHWDDFMNRNYSERYGTTLGQYTQSSNMHRALSQVDAAGDVRMYWSSIYQALVTNDSYKLDSLVQYFEHQRDSLQLNPTETAEAVVTFIQEIPYYLVHDGSCEEAMNAGNEFMTEYHMEGKPCLAQMVAGIQGPYEFIHNLKGDCDTRSLLCHALLTQLGIPSSVWVSEAYGHSLIGIGVSSAGNNYKTVSGQRHFATELTAKGFRVGMISPEHTDMDNWLITIKNP
ncbi:MAG: hypothetical protein ACKOW8_01260 [Flavobacteriales bacterium]